MNFDPCNPSLFDQLFTRIAHLSTEFSNRKVLNHAPKTCELLSNLLIFVFLIINLYQFYLKNEIFFK